MSEQKESFMQQLDAWTDSTIISPLHNAVMDGDGDVCDATRQEIKRAIRHKVLESYRNGQAAKTVAPKGGHHGR